MLRVGFSHFLCHWRLLSARYRSLLHAHGEKCVRKPFLRCFADADQISLPQIRSYFQGVQEHSVDIKYYAFDILYEAHHALTISAVIFFSEAAALQMSF